jgi:hypothetical protein
MPASTREPGIQSLDRAVAILHVLAEGLEAVTNGLSAPVLRRLRRR